MKLSIVNRRVALLVLWIYGFECTLAAHLPSSNLQSTRLGIVPIGALNDSEERAYPLVAKRIQRWLENLDSIRASAESIASNGRAGAFQQEAGENRLVRLSSQIWADSENERTESSDSLKELRRLRSQVFFQSSGPAIQKAYLAEAAFRWVRGDKRGGEDLLKKALLLSPDGHADLSLFDSQRETSPLHAFEAKILESENQLKRGCLLHLDVNRNQARIVANGFDVGSGRQLRLPIGGTFHVHAETNDEESPSILVPCERPGIKRASITLRRKKLSVQSGSLSQLSQSHSVESLCLVEPVGDSFRLFLFTPGVAVDEIPLKNPWLVAEVLDNPTTDSVPIATDAFLDLLSRHHTSRLSYLENPSADRTLIQGKMATGASSDTQWYNSWKFWAITGGIVGATVVTYLATKPSTVKSNQTGLSVTIH